MSAQSPKLFGERYVLTQDNPFFPESLRLIRNPPKTLYVIGNPKALDEGLAIIGARKATPYGKSLAKRFATIASEKGITIISGGAYGCDSEAHKAAIDAGGRTVVFLGGGCDRPYPVRHAPLFQRVIDTGGAIVSENHWDMQPLPYCFRERNRLIAGLAKATLIVEAGLPSGTFSTADAALQSNRDVLAIPGAITSPNSRGANYLISQGAIPIIDDESFQQAIFMIFGNLVQEKFTSQNMGVECDTSDEDQKACTCTWQVELLSALRACSLNAEECFHLAQEYDKTIRVQDVSRYLTERELAGCLERFSDGRFGIVRPLR